MKIGFIEPHLKVYGGIRRIVEMANRLSDRGHDVTIYHSDGSPCEWLECRARIAPGRAALESAHDVIVYNDPEPEDMFLAARARSLATFYYVLHLYERELLSGFQPRIYMGRHKRTRNLRACLRSAHVKVANASWIQRWLKEHMDIDAELLIGGVNFDLFHPLEREPRGDGAARVLASGDPRPGKGTDTVEAAVELVREDIPDVALETYYGKGIPQEEMAAVYNAADVFVDASRNSGGWNNPVAEAMACGVAVACTHNGQVEDFAFADRTALMSPQGDARALADNIVRLLGEESLRRRLAEQALRHIRTFRWSDAIDRFEAMAVKHIEAQP